MGYHLAAEREGSCDGIGIHIVVLQIVLLQYNHVRQITSCRMACHENASGIASIFTHVLEGPRYGGRSIINTVSYLHLGQQPVVDGHNAQPCFLQLVGDEFGPAFQPSTVKPHHHRIVLDGCRMVEVQFAAFCLVGVPIRAIGDVRFRLIALGPRLQPEQANHHADHDGPQVSL